ncbi:hypothetical protein EUGRSUZ_K00613 [Eucalyptus grandis]|uniref:Uncharacterized protein n=2 Tax=Eucalyptus grandis TaxID=71139 RepID=A0ACC3ISC5_EUCGR|nr:hypothetical protein EUGRSUZ_K00613 [Eucalyptus grandis]
MEGVRSISIFKTTERCDHSFCSRCMSSHIAAKIKDGAANVRCPKSDCRTMLDPITCKKLVSSVGFARRSDHHCNGSGWFRDEDIHLLEHLAERQRWKRCSQCHIYVEFGGGCKDIVFECKTQFCHGCGRKRGPSSSCACRRSLGFCLGHSII